MDNSSENEIKIEFNYYSPKFQLFFGNYKGITGFTYYDNIEKIYEVLSDFQKKYDFYIIYELTYPSTPEITDNYNKKYNIIATDEHGNLIEEEIQMDSTIKSITKEIIEVWGKIIR